MKGFARITWSFQLLHRFNISRSFSHIRIKDIVLNIDLAPTFLDIASARIPGEMDGRSLLQLLESYTSKNDALNWRETFLVEKSYVYRFY